MVMEPFLLYSFYHPSDRALHNTTEDITAFPLLVVTLSAYTYPITGMKCLFSICQTRYDDRKRDGHGSHA